MDNYAVQMMQAQKRFLSYDQASIIRKFHLPHDEDYLYPTLFSRTYRLCRKTGRLQRLEQGQWADANRFSPVMTLLDILCDSRWDRHPAGSFQQMHHFGLQFHTQLLSEPGHPLAALFEKDPDALHRICLAAGGRPVPGGDGAFVFPVVEDLELMLRFWHADADFPAQMQCFWDKNALQYLKYETMYYALGLLTEDLEHLQTEKDAV